MTLRTTRYLLIIATGLMASGVVQRASAQSVAGPLAQADAPDGTAPKAAIKKPRPLKKVAQGKSKAAEKAKPAALEPWAAVDPSRVAPTPRPEAPAPVADTKAAAVDNARPSSHPELAMKWNGNNDTATQTRTQNYGGDAEGTGAAMGLKFHF